MGWPKSGDHSGPHCCAHLAELKGSSGNEQKELGCSSSAGRRRFERDPLVPEHKYAFGQQGFMPKSPVEELSSSSHFYAAKLS